VARLPSLVAGASATRPGTPNIRVGPERVWLVDDALFALQAQFDQPGDTLEPPALRTAWAAWGDRTGSGATARGAVHDLLDASGREPPSVERWRQARRLLAQADSALAAGDLERFGRLWAALRQTLAAGRGGSGGALAPTPTPR
jgi:hypothetical protein